MFLHTLPPELYQQIEHHLTRDERTMLHDVMIADIPFQNPERIARSLFFVAFQRLQALADSIRLATLAREDARDEKGLSFRHGFQDQRIVTGATEEEWEKMVYWEYYSCHDEQHHRIPCFRCRLHGLQEVQLQLYRGFLGPAFSTPEQTLTFRVSIYKEAPEEYVSISCSHIDISWTLPYAQYTYWIPRIFNTPKLLSLLGSHL